MQAVAEKSIAWNEGVRPGDIVRRVGDVDVRSESELTKAAMDAHAKGRGGAMVLLGGPNGARWIEFSMGE